MTLEDFIKLNGKAGNSVHFFYAETEGSGPFSNDDLIYQVSVYDKDGILIVEAVSHLNFTYAMNDCLIAFMQNTPN